LLTGAVQLSTGWSGASAIAVLAVAVLVPYGCLLLAARLRVPAALAVLGVLALVAVAGYAAGAASGAVSGAGWLAVVRDGVARLLTAPRPAPSTVDLLVPGALLAVLVGLWVGIRAAAPHGGLFAPAVGAAVLYVGGALLSAGQADRNGAVAALLVACTVAGWAVLERPAQRRSATFARALPGMAFAAAVAALLAAGLPARGGFEPRHLVSPPPLPLVERNPLPRLAAFAQQGDRELFRHTSGERMLHLVAMTDFDGASWEAGARYRPVGAVASAELPAGNRRTEVSADITISGLDGAWLPAPGTPTAVSLPQTQVDTESGSLVVAGGLRAGLRYQVRGWVDTPADADLAVGAVPAATTYLQVPRLPFLFAEYLRGVLRGASTPFEQAVVIESAVRENRRLDPKAPAGSSYARLEMFLFGRTGLPGAQAGTSEQFATAFAVLARAAGLPTRVMVGFRPGTRQPDGTWVVHGRDALAWPEVYFTGHGWVPFDPTPAGAEATLPISDARRQVLDRVGQNQPPSPGPEPTPAKPTPVATASAAAPTAAPGIAAGGGDPYDLAGAAQVASTALAVAVAALALARSLRRRRHRRAGARGAWSEVLDLLVLLGRRPPPWRTAGWVAADLAAAVPTGDHHPALRLATYADRAMFSPSQANSIVDDPWPQLRRLRRAVRRSVPWYRRLTWPIDPRPLWRR
jgi:transglutaminase-like putative cysteine protease